jgi:hypothetical protein
VGSPRRVVPAATRIVVRLPAERGLYISSATFPSAQLAFITPDPILTEFLTHGVSRDEATTGTTTYATLLLATGNSWDNS